MKERRVNQPIKMLVFGRSSLATTTHKKLVVATPACGAARSVAQLLKCESVSFEHDHCAHAHKYCAEHYVMIKCLKHKNHLKTY